MRYMLIMQSNQAGFEYYRSWPPELIQRNMEFMRRISAELSETGELVSTEGLAWPEQAKIVRARNGAAPAVTDGPFPETKEFLAGYWIVDCESEARAIEIAARISAAPGPDDAPIDFPIEVRQVMHGGEDLF
ncbi:MAG: YciI family protein [Gemmatimonadetes bacterium]|nr:YciI family protein [Gemmatimonadota bacterium]